MAIPLISLLVGLIIVLLIFLVIRMLCSAFGVGEPITTVIYGVMVIFVILWLVGLMGYGPSLRLS